MTRARSQSNASQNSNISQKETPKIDKIVLLEVSFCFFVFVD